jgi:hypothetical protein
MITDTGESFGRAYAISGFLQEEVLNNPIFQRVEADNG